MWALIKKIFSRKDGRATILLMDDADPDAAGTYRISSADLLMVGGVLFAIALSVMFLIFYLTPLGSVYNQYQDNVLREELLTISERVLALRDSLEARDSQLAGIKEVLRLNPDTIFTHQFDIEVSDGLNRSVPVVAGEEGVETADMLSQREIVFSEIYRRVPEFPAPYPIDGTLSQSFSAETNHLGIDLAAAEGTEFTSIADGTIVNAGWTINYGYVIYVQHGNGYMTVYKHAARLYKADGDIVLKGDILGSIGNTGVLSFGSHLHLEIWKNGVAQNPLMYLIN